MRSHDPVLRSNDRSWGKGCDKLREDLSTAQAAVAGVEVHSTHTALNGGVLVQVEPRLTPG